MIKTILTFRYYINSPNDNSSNDNWSNENSSNLESRLIEKLILSARLPDLMNNLFNFRQSVKI